MTEYRDPITGYLVRRYTDGPERNAKLYFTTENFSTDDKYFFFNKDVEGGQETYRADIATGELTRITDKAYCGFALDRERIRPMCAATKPKSLPWIWTLTPSIRWATCPLAARSPAT